MGRQTKQGIDYFSLDTVFDDKTEMYLAECEGFGLAVLVTALQLIYSNEGYYTQNGEDFCYLIKRRISGDINIIKSCLESSLRRNLFDKGLHEQYGILTSAGIQKRYFAAAKKKKEINVIPEFLLISIDSCGNVKKVGIKAIPASGNATKVKVKVKEEVKVKEKEEVDGADTSVKPKSQPATNRLLDHEFLETLSRNPAYTDLDIQKELGKCEAWCTANSIAIPPSKKRFVNWLNRAYGKPGNGHGYKTNFDRTLENARKVMEGLQDD